MSVTAYARIFMSSVKNRENIKLYYTDTDSAFIEGNIPDDIIHNKKFRIMET